MIFNKKADEDMVKYLFEIIVPIIILGTTLYYINLLADTRVIENKIAAKETSLLLNSVLNYDEDVILRKENVFNNRLVSLKNYKGYISSENNFNKNYYSILFLGIDTKVHNSKVYLNNDFLTIYKNNNVLSLFRLNSNVNLLKPDIFNIKKDFSKFRISLYSSFNNFCEVYKYGIDEINSNLENNVLICYNNEETINEENMVIKLENIPKKYLINISSSDEEFNLFSYYFLNEISSNFKLEKYDIIDATSDYNIIKLNFDYYLFNADLFINVISNSLIKAFGEE